MSSPNRARTGDIIQDYPTLTSMWYDYKDVMQVGVLAYDGLNYILDDPVHSGVVVEKDGKLFVFHSLAGLLGPNPISGVHLMPLYERMKYRLKHGFTMKIRRLAHRESRNFEAKVHEFVDKALGKPYKYPAFGNLFKGLAAKNAFDELSKKFPREFLVGATDAVGDFVNTIQDGTKFGSDEGYFCSDLVAKLYEHLGILPNITEVGTRFENPDGGASEDYIVLPTSFNEFQDLPKGAKLGPVTTLGTPKKVQWKEFNVKFQVIFNILNKMKKGETIVNLRT